MIGGYLIVAASGRPLEFHCTLPVVPSRASAILHGSSLRAQLIVDAIGPALLNRSKIKPHIVFTDVQESLALAESSEMLIARVGHEAPPEGWVVRQHGDCTAALRPPADENLARLDAIFDSLDSTVQLDEPFQRIREALQEARSAKAA